MISGVSYNIYKKFADGLKKLYKRYNLSTGLSNELIMKMNIITVIIRHSPLLLINYQLENFMYRLMNTRSYDELKHIQKKIYNLLSYFFQSFGDMIIG